MFISGSERRQLSSRPFKAPEATGSRLSENAGRPPIRGLPVALVMQFRPGVLMQTSSGADTLARWHAVIMNAPGHSPLKGVPVVLWGAPGQAFCQRCWLKPRTGSGVLPIQLAGCCETQANKPAWQNLSELDRSAPALPSALIATVDRVFPSRPCSC